MDDADSGIYQSRTDSVVDSGETVSLSTAGNEVSSLKDRNSSTSGTATDELSDISSIESDEVSSSSYRSSDEDECSTPSVANIIPRLPKKKLSISDSFLATSIATNVAHARPELSPGMKVTYKESERKQRWDFISSQPSLKESIAPSSKQPKSSCSNPKRILKLHLSTSPLEIPSESDNTPSPTVPVTESTRASGNISSMSTTLSEAAECSDPELSQLPIYVELRDPDKLQCSEWRRIFSKDENVTILCRDFFLSEFDHDAVVVPGNSFGYLDGEPEIKFTEKFGWQIQRKVQKYICEAAGGEMLVGDAVIVRLAQDDFGNDTGIKFVIYVPTMRVPLQVRDTVNAYLAFRAAMKAVRRHNCHCHASDEIMTVLCPSLCNSFGGMPPGRIAHQMKEAYDTVMLHDGKLPAVNGLGSLATHHVDMTANSGAWC